VKRFRNVTVLKGGFSSERSVSLDSGAAVARALRERGYEVAEADVEGRDVVLPDPTDVVFIALHGEFGEDGGVQELLERRGVPYTGSGPEASRIAFDKKLARAAFAAAQVPVPAGITLTEPTSDMPMPPPIIVKPTRQGSSIGCHRVTRFEEWHTAVRDALSYNGEVVVEEFIAGLEITVGFVGQVALPPVEIRAPDGEYSYDAKYGGKARYFCPAPLKVALLQRIVATARRAYRAVGAEGFGRVDMRVTPDGEIYVLELNSIPGFTPHSLLPKAAAAAGIAFPDLCERILNLARTP